MNIVTNDIKWGDTEIIANNDISSRLEKGIGASTPLSFRRWKINDFNIFGGMTATRGDVPIDGQNIAHYNAHQLTDHRRNDVGFVFQFL